MPLEMGLDTFGDVNTTMQGESVPHAQVIRDVIDQAVLADQCGVDFIGLGEHHRPDFAISSPEVILGAIAGRTQRILLGTAVTILSSDDPVRVYQRFATLDACSNGRSECILGRGSFIESFPLFGYDLKNYEVLFEEKLELYAELLKGQPVTWRGSVRSPLQNQSVYPPPQQGKLRTWIGVGGSPESVVRAVHYGFPLTIAIIGGDPARFLPFADLYRRAHDKLGTPPNALGVHSHGHVAKTDEEARETYWPAYRGGRDKIGAERGWPPVTRNAYDQEIASGSLYVGSPETVAAKIARTAKLLGLDRFDMKYSSGPLPHAQMMSCIELYGTKVIPLVRELMEG